MFGYVKPLKGELRVCEWEIYRAAYCGLCHELRERCGFAARFAVNYDFTFFALLISSLRGENPGLVRKRCVASPCRKRNVILGGAAFEYAADASVILSYWKLCDKIADSGFFAGFPSRVGRLFLRDAYRRAEKRLPDFSRVVRSCLAELAEIEIRHTASIDMPADSFARILKSLSECIEDVSQRRVCGELMYHLGRYIYLIDAWDDLEDDLNKQSYNPIAERFNICCFPISREISNELMETVAQSIQSVICAFELLELNDNQGLLRNIVSLGLPALVEQVASGKGNKKEKIIHERSV